MTRHDGHACDCRSQTERCDWTSLTLRSERSHVLTRVRAILRRRGGGEGDGGGAQGVELEGERWPEDLAAVLEELTYSERSMLYAQPHGGSDGSHRLPLKAETVLERRRTSWLPDLFGGEARMFPYFQPIVDLRDGIVHGHEALVRAKLGDRLLSGAEIVSAAGAHDALMQLDAEARRISLERGFALLPDGQRLFVNFVPAAIYSPETCLRTTWRVARRLGMSLDRVCFEMVESEKYPDLDFLRGIVDRYRSEGAGVALDDLGAGCTSLSYLRELRPDVAKLDRALIRDLDLDASSRQLVKALTDYAHELGVKVVAEGIESPGELEAVRSLAVDYAQGFYLGRPAPEPVDVDANLVTASDRRAGAIARAA